MSNKKEVQNGVLLVDKPKGISSYDVLRILKRTFSQSKMGYLGTLDPLATGLLVVFLGKATKFIRYCEDLNKCYTVSSEIGKKSDTFDICGAITKYEKYSNPDIESFYALLDSFIGQQWQIQPPFSAIKFKGKRAYKYAREGNMIDLGKRQVEFFRIDVNNIDWPSFELEISCSSGTYIRSFVHHVGQKIGSGAIMTFLRRLSIGPFDINDSIPLSMIQKNDLIDPEYFLEIYANLIPRIQQEKSYIKSMICK